MELAAARRDELIEDLARRLEAWGLTAPAVFFLEANKLRWWSGIALVAADPWPAHRQQDDERVCFVV